MSTAAVTRQRLDEEGSYRPIAGAALNGEEEEQGDEEEEGDVEAETESEPMQHTNQPQPQPLPQLPASPPSHSPSANSAAQCANERKGKSKFASSSRRQGSSAGKQKRATPDQQQTAPASKPLVNRLSKSCLQRCRHVCLNASWLPLERVPRLIRRQQLRRL